MDKAPWLDRFVIESYMIEGIALEGVALDRAVISHQDFLASAGTVRDMRVFAYNACGTYCHLREQVGMNVRIDRHIAPAGGPEILRVLEAMVQDAPYLTPFEMHSNLLTLHPFTDGNGRTSRVFWLWHISTFPQHQQELLRAKELGFLQTFYYQALNANGARKG